MPVREERVVIERLPGSGQVTAGHDLKEGETVEVPVMKERVEVTKQPVVAEEVAIRKEVVERNEQAQETLRKEELKVDDKNGVVTNGHDTTARTAEQAAADRTQTRR